MSALLVWLPIALATAFAMELWAMLLHGRVWHSLLWRVHRTHHRRRLGAFEANDALSMLHAPIAIAAILYGCAAAPSLVRDAAFGVGIGMTMFGLAYVVVHDGLVHGRLPVEALAKIPYFARVREAHRLHHKKGARGPYGLFLGPWEKDRPDERGPIKARRPSRAAPASRKAASSPRASAP